MEIVPILSTIILVGTVATFILAVAAYILYKMREGGSGLPEEVPPTQIQPHHVVMPVDYATMMGQRGDSGPIEASTFFAPTATTPPQESYLETSNGYGRGPQSINGQSNSHPKLSHQSQQGMSLDAFFWEYTEDGFSPLHLDTEHESSLSQDSEYNSEENHD